MTSLASPAPRGERGTILFIALIVLVAMSLAGIALIRSVDTNVLIAGNLAFRQGATSGSDWGVEHARIWLMGNGDKLYNDKPIGAQFYYANWQENLDLFENNSDSSVLDYNWDNGEPADLGFDAAGNNVKYVIHRLCGTAGDPGDPDVKCVRSTLFANATGLVASKLVVSAAGGPVPSPTAVLYRITVKVTGPRNTVTYVQAVLQ